MFLRPPFWDWSRFCDIWIQWLIKKEGPAVLFGHGVSVNECLCARESEDCRRNQWSPGVTY